MLFFLTAGAVLGLSAGLSPGPLLALVLSQTIRYGAGEGVKIAAAPLVTDLPVITVSLFALSRLADSRPALGAVSIAGGLFLAYTAYETAKARAPAVDRVESQPRSVIKGVFVNALSPHPYLFWLTVGGPMLLRARDRGSFSAVGFLAGFFGCLVGSKVLVAVIAGKSRGFLTERAYPYLMRLLAALLLVFSCLLLRDGLVLVS